MVDLCTVEQVKIESLGRITDNSLDTEISYKISDISEKILEIDSSFTISDRKARKCCIYGVLAWLSTYQKIKDNKKIVSIKDGDISVNYGNHSKEGTEDNTDCEIYKSLLSSLQPFRPIAKILN